MMTHQYPYESGRQNKPNYLSDTIIKEASACLQELPYTCIYRIPDIVPPKQIVDFELEVINHEEENKLKSESEPEVDLENETDEPEIEKTEIDTFIGQAFRANDKSYVPGMNHPRPYDS